MNIHPYNSNSELYNILFHPLHKKENKILAIVTNIALTIITGSLWQIPFWILNRIDNRKVVQWKANNNPKGSGNIDTIGRISIVETNRTTKDNKKADKTKNSTLSLTAKEFIEELKNKTIKKNQKIIIKGDLDLRGVL